MQVTAAWTPGGDVQTWMTLNRMRRLARQGMIRPDVRARAIGIVADVPGRDGAGQIAALRSWLEAHSVFVRDPVIAELLIAPWVALQDIDRQGVAYYDCDDAAILAAALGGAVGLKVRFVVVGFRAPNAPFKHVWTELAAPSGTARGRWVDMDVTRRSQRLPHLESRKWAVPI